ncbi:MAG: TetR/AcrR family transcriptional regulator [Acidimicrobiaceae bacterium]|nr:TetR/AcrR family transcriptional regulator [Acidimicrobiaceae bacterium]
MPKLWSATIEAHRREVREAIIDATHALAIERGRRSVTMSQIAEETGIGRATLYKYFPDVDAILLAWHDRHVAGYLERLHTLAHGGGDAAERLEAVLHAVALKQQNPHAGELGPFLHLDEHVSQAREHLSDLICGLLVEGVEEGSIRGDVAPDELARYSLYALAGARGLPSGAAVDRLVAVTLAGLRPPP